MLRITQLAALILMGFWANWNGSQGISSYCSHVLQAGSGHGIADQPTRGQTNFLDITLRN